MSSSDTQPNNQTCSADVEQVPRTEKKRRGGCTGALVTWVPRRKPKRSSDTGEAVAQPEERAAETPNVILEGETVQAPEVAIMVDTPSPKTPERRGSSKVLSMVLFWRKSDKPEMQENLEMDDVPQAAVAESQSFNVEETAVPAAELETPIIAVAESAPVPEPEPEKVKKRSKLIRSLLFWRKHDKPQSKVSDEAEKEAAEIVPTAEKQSEPDDIEAPVLPFADNLQEATDALDNQESIAIVDDSMVDISGVTVLEVDESEPAAVAPVQLVDQQAETAPEESVKKRSIFGKFAFWSKRKHQSEPIAPSEEKQSIGNQIAPVESVPIEEEILVAEFISEQQAASEGQVVEDRDEQHEPVIEQSQATEKKKGLFKHLFSRRKSRKAELAEIVVGAEVEAAPEVNVTSTEQPLTTIEEESINVEPIPKADEIHEAVALAVEPDSVAMIVAENASDQKAELQIEEDPMALSTAEEAAWVGEAHTDLDEASIQESSGADHLVDCAGVAIDVQAEVICEPSAEIIVGVPYVEQPEALGDSLSEVAQAVVVEAKDDSEVEVIPAAVDGDIPAVVAVEAIATAADDDIPAVVAVEAIAAPADGEIPAVIAVEAIAAPADDDIPAVVAVEAIAAPADDDIPAVVSVEAIIPEEVTNQIAIVLEAQADEASSTDAAVEVPAMDEAVQEGTELVVAEEPEDAIPEVVEAISLPLTQERLIESSEKQISEIDRDGNTSPAPVPEEEQRQSRVFFQQLRDRFENAK